MNARLVRDTLAAIPNAPRPSKTVHDYLYDLESITHPPDNTQNAYVSNNMIQNIFATIWIRGENVVKYDLQPSVAAWLKFNAELWISL